MPLIRSHPPPRTVRRSRLESGSHAALPPRPRRRLFHPRRPAFRGVYASPVAVRIAVCLAVLWLQTVAAQTIRVSCVGDSITYGLGSSWPSDTSYPSVLQKSFGDAWAFANFGVIYASMQKNADYPYWSRPEFDLSMASEPDAVVVMLGTNDAWPANWSEAAPYRFASSYLDLIARFRSLPTHPAVFICTPCPAYDAGLPWSLDWKVANFYVPVVRQISLQTGAPLIDIFSLMRRKSALFPDGHHPDNEGYAMIAAEIGRSLENWQSAAPVSIETPSSGETMSADQPLEIVARASATGDALSSLSLYADGQLLGQTSNSPARIRWESPAAGLKRLVAVATYRSGLVRTSSTAAVTFSSNEATRTVLRPGDLWRVWDSDQAPAADWTLPTFEDHGWPLLLAPLGYGAPGLASVASFGHDPANKRVVTYLRHTIVFPDRHSYETLRLRLRPEWGAIVYINGIEVLRQGLPPGPLPPNQVGTLGGASGVGSDGLLAHTNRLGRILVQETNTVAVEVHLPSRDAASLIFDFALEAREFAQPPDIYWDPAPQWVDVGDNIQLRAVASGTEPMTFSWYKNATNFIGSTPTGLLNLGSATLSFAGIYTVVASNAAGSSTSGPVAVRVGFAPAFLAPPSDQLVDEGANVALTAKVSGTPPFDVTWQKDGAIVDHRETLTQDCDLSLPDVAPEKAGSYRVVVRNRLGEVVSAPAVLQIDPIFPHQPSDFLRLRIQQLDANSVSARFFVASNSVCVLQAAGRIDSKTWDDLWTGGVVPTNRTVSLAQPSGTLGSRFFRLRISDRP